ncbi:MAG: hypothetical protein ACFFBD_01825, partial [Candidatus Hodarchaeota archaeon]
LRFIMTLKLTTAYTFLAEHLTIIENIQTSIYRMKGSFPPSFCKSEALIYRIFSILGGIDFDSTENKRQ